MTLLARILPDRILDLLLAGKSTHVTGGPVHRAYKLE
jgi:hypothetical protein